MTAMRRRYDHPRWLENGVAVIIGSVAFFLFVMLLVAFVCLSLMFVSRPAPASPSVQPDRPFTEADVRRDCTYDALRYCKIAIPQGRPSIINCMLENRDKLQAKCSRHLRFP